MDPTRGQVPTGRSNHVEGERNVPRAQGQRQRPFPSDSIGALERSGNSSSLRLPFYPSYPPALPGRRSDGARTTSGAMAGEETRDDIDLDNLSDILESATMIACAGVTPSLLDALPPVATANAFHEPSWLTGARFQAGHQARQVGQQPRQAGQQPLQAGHQARHTRNATTAASPDVSLSTMRRNTDWMSTWPEPPFVTGTRPQAGYQARQAHPASRVQPPSREAGSEVRGGSVRRGGNAGGAYHPDQNDRKRKHSP